MEDDSNYHDHLEGNVLALPNEMERFVKDFCNELKRLLTGTLLDPGEMIDAAKGIFALRRLPLTTPGMCLDLDCIVTYGDSAKVIWSAKLAEDEFKLSSIESSYGEWGSDRYTRVYLAITPGSKLRSDFDCPLVAAEEWLGQWRQIASQGEIYFCDNCETGWSWDDEIAPKWGEGLK